MPFVEVATTERKKLTPTQRLKIWERDRGVCCLCGGKIDGAREKWIVEHLRALELGGADDPSNMGVAHAGCADAKTHGPNGDHARAAKAKRVKRKALGIEKSKSPLPGSRATRWKRKMDGSVVRRET